MYFQHDGEYAQNDPFNELKEAADRKTIIVVKEVHTPEENTLNDSAVASIDHEMLIDKGNFEWVSIPLLVQHTFCLLFYQFDLNHSGGCYYHNHGHH